MAVKGERGHQLHYGTKVLKVNCFSHPPAGGCRTRYCSNTMKGGGSGARTKAPQPLLAVGLSSYASATTMLVEEIQ